MITYIVYRHGSNAANQPLQAIAVLGTIVVKRPLQRRSNSDALRKWAEERGEQIYANQRLSYVLFSRASRLDRARADELDSQFAVKMATPILLAVLHEENDA